MECTKLEVLQIPRSWQYSRGLNPSDDCGSMMTELRYQQLPLSNSVEGFEKNLPKMSVQLIHQWKVLRKTFWRWVYSWYITPVEDGRSNALAAQVTELMNPLEDQWNYLPRYPLNRENVTDSICLSHLRRRTSGIIVRLRNPRNWFPSWSGLWTQYFNWFESLSWSVFLLTSLFLTQPHRRVQHPPWSDMPYDGRHN